MNKIKKALVILPYIGFRDDEYLAVTKKLQNDGAEITIASTNLGYASGMMGEKVKVDTLMEKVSPKDFDAIILISGEGVGEIIHNSFIHFFLIQANQLFKFIAAIGRAALALAYAGVLVGRRATVAGIASKLVEEGGGYYTGKDVERDANIITASGPQAAEEFALKIKEALLK